MFSLIFFLGGARISLNGYASYVSVSTAVSLKLKLISQSESENVSILEVQNR